MHDLGSLIHDSIRAARELNRLAIAERRRLRACEVRLNAGENCCGEYNARGDALWQLDAARDDCIAFARGLRRVSTYVKPAEVPTWTT